MVPGKTVQELPALSSLTQQTRDAETWTTIFECDACGSLWQESYSATGHGEVPEVRRLNAE